MFTGLVQWVGRVAAADASPAGRRIVVDVQGWGHRAGMGESISVNGCCLTVAGGEGDRLAFDAVPETLAKTTLGRLSVGSRVNLEHSATVNTLLGGHVVQGHVDGMGEVLRVVRPARVGEGEWRVRIGVPGGLMEFVTPKGSVSVEGVSLTVAGLDVGAKWLEVALIPVTLEATTLADLREGEGVNLEMDVFAKTVVHWLRHFGGARG